MASILILDDEYSVCKIVKSILLKKGHSVAFILQSEYLFLRLQSETFDLILLDVNMPGTDGVTLLHQLKQHTDYQKIPVVMLTGDTNEQLLAKCFAEGSTDFVHKPISELVLNARIRSVLLEQQMKESLEAKVKERTIELNQLNRIFQKFVPKPFLDRILNEAFYPGKFEKEEMSVLFSDIRAYTQMSETLDPEENFNFIHSFYSEMEPMIAEHQGFVDKYIGDGIMALFGNEHSADQAVRAAIAMHHQIDKYNKKREFSGKAPIQIGIGINTGNVMIGALGSVHRLNSTVIGDPVNVSSRIEELTKRYQSRILISHHTYERLQSAYCIRFIDKTNIRGRTEPICLYEVFDADPPEIKIKKQQISPFLSQGIALYQKQQFKEATQIFENCLRVFPQDNIVYEYLVRCHRSYKYTKRFGKGINMTRNSDPALRTQIRHVPRYPLEVDIQIIPTYKPSVVSQKYPFGGRVSDISELGLQIRLSGPLEKGDRLRGNLFFQESILESSLGKKPYEFLGCVVWVKQSQTNKTKFWKIGLEIIINNDQQEQAFCAALKQLELLQNNTTLIDNGINFLTREV